MSHIVTIQCKMKDRAAILAACSRLKLDAPSVGTFQLYGDQATGLGVQLEGWQYPIVIASDGAVAYDNYGGHWGAQAGLDAFRQAYAVEAAKIAARKKGHTVSEAKLSDGSIRLTVTEGR